MGEIVEFPGYTVGDIPEELVLEAAERYLNRSLPMIIVGYDENDELYVASTKSEVGELALLLERAKNFLL